MNIDTLIADLAKQLNLEDSLHLNEQGYLALEVNDSLVVNLQWHSADEHLIMFTPLFNLSEAIGEEQTKDRDGFQNQILRNLLGANLFWQGTAGGTLSLDLDSEWIWLTDKRFFSTFSQSGALADWLLQHIEAAKTFLSKTFLSMKADLSAQATGNVAPEAQSMSAAVSKPSARSSKDDKPGNGHWIQG